MRVVPRRAAVLAILALLLLAALALLGLAFESGLWRLCDERTNGNLYQTQVCMGAWLDQAFVMLPWLGLSLAGAGLVLALRRRAKRPGD